MLEGSIMDPPRQCCGDLFADWVFSDIREARPEPKKGIYVIRVKQPGTPLDEILREADAALGRIGWQMLTESVSKRLRRMEKMDDCPLIYIGSAGTYSNSKNTLIGRYGDFTGRHTIMFPLWLLLYYGWKIEYGCKPFDEAMAEEGALKVQYRQKHRDQLPALCAR